MLWKDLWAVGGAIVYNAFEIGIGVIYLALAKMPLEMSCCRRGVENCLDLISNFCTPKRNED